MYAENLDVSTAELAAICDRFEAVLGESLSADDLTKQITALKIELAQVKARSAAKAPPKGVIQFKIDEFDVHTKIRGFSATVDIRTPVLKLLGAIFSNLIANFIYGSVSKSKPDGASSRINGEAGQ